MDKWKLLSILLAGLVLGYIGARVECSFTKCSLMDEAKVIAEAPTPTQEPSAPEPEITLTEDEQKLLIETNDPMLGNENAPVTIVEFSDYQCPFCGRYSTETFHQIKTDYIDPGKVKYYFKDLPLGFHAQAKNAAKAANCALEQGKYWEMHDALFKKQSEWSESPEVFQLFATYAKELGLDTDKLETCAGDPAQDEEIDNDTMMANKTGTSGTPTFFINGKKLVGAQPYAIFKAAIEEALN